MFEELTKMDNQIKSTFYKYPFIKEKEFSNEEKNIYGLLAKKKRLLLEEQIVILSGLGKSAVKPALETVVRSGVVIRHDNDNEVSLYEIHKWENEEQRNIALDDYLIHLIKRRNTQIIHRKVASKLKAKTIN